MEGEKNRETRNSEEGNSEKSEEPNKILDVVPVPKVCNSISILNNF